MLGELTLYSTLSPQPVDSQIEQKASENYLVNTDCIIYFTDETTLRTIRYKLNPYDDRAHEFYFLVTNSASAITTLADADAASSKISLNVFEDIQTFDLVTSVTTVTWNFNVDDIVWGENDPTDTYARIFVLTGGNKVTPYIVDHNISQIVDLADTGTTTTTTSSTSTTSA